MRILHVTAQKPDYTGSGIYLKNAIKWAQTRGYEQALVAGVEEEDLLKLRLEGIRIFPVVFGRGEVSFPVLGMSDVMPYPSLRYGEMTQEQYQAWDRAFAKTLEQARKEFLPDVVLSHHLWLLTAKVREVFAGIPVAGISHGSDLRQMKRNPRLGQKAIEGCCSLELIFALNVHQKNEIAAFYGCPLERIQVAGAGFDDTIFYPPSEADSGERIQADAPRRVIYAGKMARAKGLLPLFDAVDILQQQRDVELLLAGTGAEGQELAALAPPGTRFLGRLTQNELAREFRQADLFVLPSYFEGLPLVLLEALGTGLPCVCSDLPGVREWLGPVLDRPEYIRFVPLPRLVRGDEPVAADLPAYGKGLCLAMESLLGGTVNRSNLGALGARGSWTAVFDRIEEELIRTVKSGKV